MIEPAETGAKKEKQWWRGGVTYHIYPRSFQDSNNDGIGDLPGIISRLDYIAGLGVDSIWISPFFKSPMKDFGYDVSDYRDVDPIFGTLADFDRLIERAHQLGLKIMIDQVLSHTSDQHRWFVESRRSRDNPKADWYVWADPKSDGTPPNNWQSVFGGSAWHWDARRRQYYFHNFLSSQPDLNFHSEEVQQHILDDVRFWCERGVDGFRFDACNFHFHDRLLRDNPPAKEDTAVSSVRKDNPYSMQQHRFDKNQPENLDFLKKLRILLNQYGAVSLGEVGDEEALSIMAQYTSGGDKLHMAYSFNLLTPEFSAGHIRRQVEELEKNILPVGGWGCWSLSNHDVVRVMTRWGGHAPDVRLAKLLLAMLGTLRGSLCIYQGEELGLTEADVPFELLQDPYGINFWPEFKGRDGCRTPIPWSDQSNGGFSQAAPWLPVPAEHITRSVAVQEKDKDSVLAFYRHFLGWRRMRNELVWGDIQFGEAPEPVLMLQRTHEGKQVFSAFNLGQAAITVKVPEGIKPLDGHGLKGALLENGQLHMDTYGGFFGEMR